MRPHRTDGVSLAFGLFFLMIALWWAVSRVVDLRLPALGWMVAGGLIIFGAIGLLGAIRSGRAEPATPIAAETQTPPSDLPPEMHASIVRELMEDPAGRFGAEHPDPAARRTPQE